MVFTLKKEILLPYQNLYNICVNIYLNVMMIVAKVLKWTAKNAKITPIPKRLKHKNTCQNA